jgi:succinate-semialdehyde dehydrogenase/glutarate-semialdehyde dehydrogenase
MPTSTLHREPSVLIDGEWVGRDSQVDVTDPASGELIGSIDHPTGDAAVADATAAANAAAAAFPSWAATPPKARADILHEGAAAITKHAEALALLLAREAGKRLPEARGEIAFSVEYFRWFAEEARRLDGGFVTGDVPGRRHLVMHRPAGVVASLTPWNFPCSIQARKLAPALAAGCTVVARVAEEAPLAVTEMIRLLNAAGLPDGVLNLVHGPGQVTTEAILQHPAVRVVTFTGSTGVGRSIMEQASKRIVRPLLELGGDAPFIVFDDADVDAAVAGALLGRFRNTGQSCVGANRFYVQDGIYDEFVEKFVAATDAMTVGDTTGEDIADLGPVIHERRKAEIEAIIDDAIARGGKVLTKQRELPKTGSWVAPTLVADVPDDALLATTEVFGPAAGIFRFTDEADAVRRANNTEMGLAGYVWSRDVSRCFTVAEQLEVGIVGVNEALPSAAYSPMGGVKQSGLGREGAHVGIEEFTDIRYASFTL